MITDTAKKGKSYNFTLADSTEDKIGRFSRKKIRKEATRVKRESARHVEWLESLVLAV